MRPEEPMPHYRKLHTKILESLDVNDMPDDFTRLFWLLLPLALCREGRGIDNPRWLAAKLFPLRTDVTPEQITTAFDWLCDRGMIVRYSDSTAAHGEPLEPRPYFYLPNWRKYQGNTERESPSDYPEPPCPVGAHAIPVGAQGIAPSSQDPLATNSGPAPEPLMSKSRLTHEQLMTNSCSAATATATATSAARQKAAAPAAPAAALVDDELINQLRGLGVEPATAFSLLMAHSPQAIAGWIAYANTQPQLKNPAAFVIARLQRGLSPPPLPKPKDENPRRFLSGRFADLIET